MTLNAADRKSIRAAEKAAALAERNRGEVLISLMATNNGRKFVWDWLESLHIFGTPVDPDTHRTYFLLGEQNAGKRLLDSILQWCPDQFIQAMREANERRTSSPGAGPAGLPDDRTAAAEYDGGEDAGRDLEGPESTYGTED